jgi:hypothetical protein
MGRCRRIALAHAGALAALGAVAAAPAPAAVPAVSALAPANVTSLTATLRGRVNPRGLPTTVFFQYGTTIAYGAQTPPSGAGAGTALRTVLAPIGSLAPTTTYHFRLVARNASGTVVTGDRTFRTTAQPLALAIGALPNPVAFGGPATIAGTLSGTGSGGRPIQLQQKAFPFVGGFANVGNAVVTDGRGRFSVALLALGVTTQFRAVATDRAGIVSPVLTVGVAPIVRSRVSRSRIRRGARVHFSGTLRPAEPGRPLAIQKRRGGRWITVSGTVTRPGGAGFAVYGKTIRVARGGLFRVFAGAGSGATTTGAGRTIRISTSR